ncbi:siderophore-iron reductase FhuF [Pseudomonas sp. SDI]|uniref:siderophore-iron reductase FhuF n=1 Tax=Pseudomonas sp. SDI TaxID=2170734 RepID=UPI000DE7152D|nr:siderophore-iron reductase FhuF [Pseudomonas sp. SDI]PWB32881.1 siderophore-iron reductase FhuF [Pseudomonas sp. SDI]
MILGQLLRAERFHPLLLALYGAELMPAQLPVLASQWSKYYFAMLWQAASLGQVPPWHEDLAIELDERGLPLAFGRSAAPYCASLQAVLEQHLRPLIAALAQVGEVPAAVLWGNAGDCLEQQLKDHPQARQLLDTPGSPLFAAVRYSVAGVRCRRSCCLSYKVDWVGHCEHCPLLSGADQAQ